MVDQITVEYLPTVSIGGHSNADGWGKSKSLIEDYPELSPIENLSTDTGTTDGSSCYWKNIFVATTSQPFPGPSHTPTVVDPDVVSWVELTICNVKAQADVHPHAHPYNYPNNRGSCYPRYYYNAWTVTGFTGFHHGYSEYGNKFQGTLVGIEIPLMVAWRDEWGTQVGLAKVAFSSTLFLPSEVGPDPAAWLDISLGGAHTPASEQGVEATFSYDGESGGPFLVGETLTFGSPSGTGTLLSLTDNGSTGSMVVRLLTGSTPVNNSTITGGTTGATAAVDGSVSTTDYTVPSSVDVDTVEQYAYWAPRSMWDWSPATARLYEIWAEKLLGAKAAMPAGKHIDVRLLVMWFGDNDALSRTRDYMEVSFKAACLAMIYAKRKFLVVNGLTRLPLEQIPVVWMKVHYGYNGPALAADFIPTDFCNQCLEEIATDDPYVRLVDTDDLETLLDEGSEPPLGMGTGATHFSHNGYVVAARRVMDAWREIVNESSDAISDQDRVSVEEAISELRTRYDRSGTTSNVRRDDAIKALNSAIRHVVNCAGDSCWWLNQTMTMRLTFGTDGVASLPRHVARALEIRDVGDAKKKYQFRQVGFGDGGRCQVVFENEDSAGSGTGLYRVEHIRWPLAVSTDAQLMPIPRQLLEWVVVEACKRLASGTDNIAKFSMLNGEAAQIEGRAMRQIARQLQAQRDAMENRRPRIRLDY